MESEPFDGGNAGASLTTPATVGSLRKNGHCILKGYPCKIVEMNVAKVGKHGSAKAKITGIDIFTGNKHEEIHPTGHNIDVPNIARVELTLLDIDNQSFASLMNDDGKTRQDIQIADDEVGRSIRSLFDAGETVQVTILQAMGMEKIVAGKSI